MLKEGIYEHYKGNKYELLFVANYISFVAYISSDTVEIKKLYPEQDICVRFKIKGRGILYAYCNKHGMFKLIL